ncbi:MAG: HsdM family class I SAM-dependent methyltransferase [Promethearchaeota archaeon]
MDFFDKPRVLLEFSQNFLTYLFQRLFSGKIFALTELEAQYEDIPNQKVIPTTLGHCYEQIILPQQKSRAQKGIFYSPSGEIRCTIAFALYSYLEKALPTIDDAEKEKLFELLTIPLNLNRSSESETVLHFKFRERCLQQLAHVSILDPACGSGSFLIHLLNQINRIDPDYWNHHSTKSFPRIYGLDISPLASVISDFRVWCWLYDHPASTVEKWSEFYHSGIIIRTGDYLIDKNIFAEGDPNFDIIVGNPPYIRNRDIISPAGNISLKNQEYRNKIRINLQESLGLPQLPTSRLDYALYFCFHALTHLTPGGVLGFIISNSWLNVKYGAFFQDYLVKHYDIRYILDNHHRSFPTAEINTVITIIQNPAISKSEESNQPIHFIQLNKSYAHLFNSSSCNDVSALFQRLLGQTKEFFLEKQSILLDKQKSGRIFSISKPELHKMSISQLSSPPLIGHSWGTFFFSAPDFIFQIHNELGSNLLFLSEIAEIHRGITTNCNEFFILTHLDHDLYTNGYGDQFHLDKSYLVPFLTSPKQLTSPQIQINQLKTFLFYTSDSKPELEKRNATNILQYIEYGETKHIKIKKGAQKGKVILGVHQLASFRSKFRNSPNTWYCLKKPLKSLKSKVGEIKTQIIIQKIFNTTFKVGYCSDSFVPNNTFYKIIFQPNLEIDTQLIMALLLNSLALLSLELRGRTNFGGGALDTATFDIGKILILNPKNLSEKQKQELVVNVQKVVEQPFPNAPPKSLSSAQKTLDQTILSHLTTSLTPEHVYQEFRRIQQIRTNKTNLFTKKVEKKKLKKLNG